MPFLAVVLVATCGYGQDIGEQRISEVAPTLLGKPSPNLEIPLLDGRTVHVGASQAGKPVYLKFWATWCVPCREQMPHLQSAFEKYGDELDVVAVNVGLNDDLNAVRAFQDKYDLTVPIAMDADGSIGRALKLTVTPQHVLIDRLGTVRYMSHLASEELDEALMSVVKEERPSAADSLPAVGPSNSDSTDSLELLDGSIFQAGVEGGTPSVLFFFAAWCDWYLAETRPAMSSDCVAFQEEFSALFKRFGDRAEWVGIAQTLWTTDEDIEAYRRRHSVAFPLGLDVNGTWFARYEVRDVPTVVVLDAKREVHAVVTADIDGLAGIVEKLIGTDQGTR